jgi:hypothetical protein
MHIETQMGPAVARTCTRSSDWIALDPANDEQVLVIADTPLDSAIADVVHAFGFDTVVAATPLDAICKLTSLRDRLAAIVISPDVVWAGDFRELLAEEFPELDPVVLAS